MNIAAALPAETGTLIAFPRADLRRQLTAALKHHRLTENLAAELVRDAAGFPDISAEAALAFALDQRMTRAPLALEKAHGILLVGPEGVGKTTVATRIVHAAQLMGRNCVRARADSLALFRTASHPADVLTVMEADGFNPLNVRAASAFSALGEIEGVETIGVVSALSDAEDVADLVSAFRFRRVIVTNLDRTRRLGAVLAALTAAAQAHVCASLRPEDGLEFLTPGALARQLLDGTTH